MMLRSSCRAWGFLFLMSLSSALKLVESSLGSVVNLALRFRSVLSGNGPHLLEVLEVLRQA